MNNETVIPSITSVEEIDGVRVTMNFDEVVYHFDSAD